MDMQIVFPGGKRVQSIYKGFTVETDQPVNEGGEGTAPEPFDLFLSSIGTCAGVYVIYFCEARGISTEGIKMDLAVERNEKTHLMQKIVIRLDLPDDFPMKYKKAVVKAAEMCTVKRNILNPPDIQVRAV
ncbi:MAG: OsmC family protein [Desulfobacteraceae bacterium]|jgi:ribosomal protein S12 methylthiotransferase accessory factor